MPRPVKKLGRCWLSHALKCFDCIVKLTPDMLGSDLVARATTDKTHPFFRPHSNTSVVRFSYSTQLATLSAKHAVAVREAPCFAHFTTVVSPSPQSKWSFVPALYSRGIHYYVHLFKYPHIALRGSVLGCEGSDRCPSIFPFTPLHCLLMNT